MNSIELMENFKNKLTNECTKPGSKKRRKREKERERGRGRGRGLCHKSSLAKGTRRSTGSVFPGGQNKKGDCGWTTLWTDLVDSGDFKGHPTSLRLGLIYHLALRAERKGSNRVAASPEHQPVSVLGCRTCPLRTSS